jgi:hypothetical protein
MLRLLGWAKAGLFEATCIKEESTAYLMAAVDRSSRRFRVLLASFQARQHAKARRQ